MNFVYTGQTKAPWPTLRQLVDGNQRLIVFTESGRPGVPWLHPVLETILETPYTFAKQEDFSCKPNRGHFITVDFYDIGDVVRVAHTLNGDGPEVKLSVTAR